MMPIKFHIFPALGLTITAAFFAACSTVESQAAKMLRTATVTRMVGRSTPPETKVLDADPDGCTWVAATGSVRFGDQDTKHQAFAQAIAEARRKAVDTLLGVRIDHSFMDFQSENSLRGEFALTENLLRVTQLGRAIKENVLRLGPVDDPDCVACRIEAQIQTCLVPEKERRDNDFQVHVRLNRSSYQDGDEVIITVTSTRDSYLYIYNVDMDFRAALIAPNKYVPSVRVKAGEAWVYPSDDLRAKGLRATAYLLPGSSVSAETIRVVASKAALPTRLCPQPISEKLPSRHFLSFCGRFWPWTLNGLKTSRLSSIRRH